jgi:hypothetical protein
MPDEAAPREHARRAIHSGERPRQEPDRPWGGPGVGVPCSVCEKAITRDQGEYEIQFPRDGDNPGLDTVYVHLWCLPTALERTKPAT